MKGELMRSRGKVVVWCRAAKGILPGFLSLNGGRVKRMRDAASFEGVGIAIRVAQIHKVAIVSW